MKIFLIAGKAGSGKTDAAKFIKRYYEAKSYKVVITEVSKYLKLYAKEIIDWDGNNDTKPRTFLQEIGSTLRHEIFNEDFLINRLLDDIKVYEKYADILVVSDVRLPNEIIKIKEKYPAVSIKIINNISLNNLSEIERNHETETKLDEYQDYDYIIINDEANKLNEKVINVIKEVDKNE